MASAVDRGIMQWSRLQELRYAVAKTLPGRDDPRQIIFAKLMGTGEKMDALEVFDAVLVDQPQNVTLTLMDCGYLRPDVTEAAIIVAACVAGSLANPQVG